MPCVWRALAVVLSAGAAMAQAPAYTASSIVNASDYSPGPFAPGSLISIFGSNLAFGTSGLTSDNTGGGTLPFFIGNVSVIIDNATAPLLYVSPTQINVMIPPTEVPGNASLYIVRQNVVGPTVTLPLVAAAPALFVAADHSALAQDYNANYALATAASPAKPGDLMILYATGLGYTQPLPQTGAIPETPADITGFTSGALSVLLNGKPIDQSTIAYAGLTPGFAGLYQINFYIPGDCAANPQIQVVMGAQSSAANVTLAVAAPQ